MKYDTAGNIIYELIQNCECGLTGGCEKCNPFWDVKMTELEKEQQKLDKWKKRFNEDMEQRNKILFPNPPAQKRKDKKMKQREIKFRAWNKHEERMISWTEIENGSENTLKENFEQMEKIGFVLLQFTGLADKQGKEIYEGDIVKIFCGQEGGSGNYEFNIIEFEGDGFKCKPSYEDLHSATINNFVEVIGNVFENKELLKKKK